MYVRPLPPGVYVIELKFDIEKIGVVCVYPCSNMLIVVCYDISKVGGESSIVIQL
jgi:hypothetical protein